MTDALLDIIYPVRPGDDNEELRYSLRSLRNFPHNQVWIVGHKPPWVTNTRYIPGNRQRHRRANLWHNILAACQHPDVSDEVVIFNDDFFITQPIDHAPILSRGTLDDHINLKRVQRGAPWWRDSLITTRAVLQTLGHLNPISYELHTPFPANKHLMAETLERFQHITPHNPPQWRSLYGNLHITTSRRAGEDAKAYCRGPLRTPFHSTEDASFRYFRDDLNTLFPTPSRYEQ